MEGQDWDPGEQGPWEDPADYGPFDSGTQQQDILRWCRQVLEHAGHTACGRWDTARYIPEEPAVVCGCGVMVRPPEEAPGTAVVAYQPRDPINSALPLIDPTQVYSPEQVERHILDVLVRLETGALFERQCVEAAHRAIDAWERKFARALVSSEASAADRRKAEALVACDDAGLTQAKMEAVMLQKAVAATMHNLRATLSGYQSVAKSVTAAYQPGGSAGRF